MKEILNHIWVIIEGGIVEKWWLVVIATIIFWGIYLMLQKKQWTKWKQFSAYSVMLGFFWALSLAGILTLTLLEREYNPERLNFEFELFWSYRIVLESGDPYTLSNIISNYLLFVPFGFLLPSVFAPFEKARRTVLVGFCLSVGIEIIQGVFCLGLFEFDDMIGNTLGMLIGWLLWKGAVWLRAKIVSHRL